MQRKRQIFKVAATDKSSDVRDIKIFAKNKNQLESLKCIIRIYSQDIGMGLNIEKYSIFIMKKVKRETTEGKELPNRKLSEYLKKKKITNNWNSRRGQNQAWEEKRKK